MYEEVCEFSVSSLPVVFAGVRVFICPRHVINVAFLCTQMLVKVVMKALGRLRERESLAV